MRSSPQPRFISFRIVRYIAACVACSLAGVGTAFPKVLEGVYLPDCLQTHAHVLELAVCGVRDTLWVEHYVTAVYVPRGTSVQVVRNAAQPKAVALHVVEDRYLPDEIPRKWRRALESALDAVAMAKLRQAYRRLRRGDSVSIIYTPRQGVTLSVNDRVLVRVPGHRVISAILAAWAQGESLSAKLRRLELEHACRTTSPSTD